MPTFRPTFRSFLLTLALLCLATRTLPIQAGEAVRIASGVSGHIHPAACVAKSGTVVIIFGQSDYKDLKLTRSTDGGRKWSEPVPFEPSAKQSIYPGSLTTLRDGTLVHFWNVWYAEPRREGGKSRFATYSLSKDDGETWSEPHDLPKSKDPAIESVIRHPLIELESGAWLITLIDQTAIYDPQTGEIKPLGDGRNLGLTPLVRTPAGTLISGTGLRSTDMGATWEKIAPFPTINDNGWRFDLLAHPNGWLITQEVIGPGTGGDYWRFVVSKDDGKTWDFDHTVELYNPHRPIGGRACPKTVPLDEETLGTVYYDVDAKQEGGPGVFFVRTGLGKFGGK